MILELWLLAHAPDTYELCGYYQDTTEWRECVKENQNHLDDHLMELKVRPSVQVVDQCMADIEVVENFSEYKAQLEACDKE